MVKHKNVEAYIAAAPSGAQPLLQQLRELVKSCIPQAEESISWNVPFYKYHGPLAGFAAYKNHVSFGIASGVLEKQEREALAKKGYKTGLRTLQIAFGQKVPAAIIKKILKERAQLNKTKKTKK